MGPIELIERVRRRLASPKSWVRGALKSGDRYCLRGAINFEQTGSALFSRYLPSDPKAHQEMSKVQGIAIRLLRNAFESLQGVKYTPQGKPIRFVSEWNDSSTHAQVLAALDLAIGTQRKVVENTAKQVPAKQTKELVTT